jgi:hypothetical protein
MSNETQLAIKHLGTYRPGVTPRSVALDCRVLKTLFRWGALRRSALQTRLGGMNLEELQAALDRLQQWEMLEVNSTGFTNGFHISLTDTGKHWATEILAQAYAEGRREILATGGVTA